MKGYLVQKEQNSILWNILKVGPDMENAAEEAWNEIRWPDGWDMSWEIGGRAGARELLLHSTFQWTDPFTGETTEVHKHESIQERHFNGTGSGRFGKRNLIKRTMKRMIEDMMTPPNEIGG